MKHLIVALAIVAASCSATVERFPIDGYVHAGPTCPTTQQPPAPGCEDRPVAGAELAVWGPADNEVARVSTDADGRFRLELPAGDYLLVPQPVEGLMGTAGTYEFTLPGTASLDVAYDTGIR